jgi:hypothetical protein
MRKFLYEEPFWGKIKKSDVGMYKAGFTAHMTNTNKITFMFEFPCIISLYYIKNQQDATLAVLFINHCKITIHVSDAFCTNRI